MIARSIYVRHIILRGGKARSGDFCHSLALVISAIFANRGWRSWRRIESECERETADLKSSETNPSEMRARPSSLRDGSLYAAGHLSRSRGGNPKGYKRRCSRRIINSAAYR